VHISALWTMTIAHTLPTAPTKLATRGGRSLLVNNATVVVGGNVYMGPPPPPPCAPRKAWLAGAVSQHLPHTLF
jgi:hypothetical protein